MLPSIARTATAIFDISGGDETAAAHPKGVTIATIHIAGNKKLYKLCDCAYPTDIAINNAALNEPTENDMTILYTTEAVATGGRTGIARSSDGHLSVTLDTPKELGGAGGAGTNPEQLFAAGYAACFLGALKYVAGHKRMKLAEDSSVAVTVGVGPRADGKGFGLDLALSVTLPGIEREVAEDLVAQADIVCPYSHLACTDTAVRLTVA